MAVPVNMFNANPLTVEVSINNGAPFQIAGAASPNWVPQMPTVNIGFTGGGPARGALGIGTNNVVMTPVGAVTPFFAQITLSGNVNWQSIQLYIFFRSYESCSWILLNAGQIVGQATVASAGA